MVIDFNPILDQLKRINSMINIIKTKEIFAFQLLTLQILIILIVNNLVIQDCSHHYHYNLMNIFLILLKIQN